MSLRTVAANGVRFAVVEEGEGPLALLLHGFPDTPQTWDRVRPALARAGYRAASPFMRGYHPTEIPADGAYDMDTLGRDALALIEALGEREAILVGHDWGAAAAYAAAGLAPERIRKLVAVGLPHPAAVTPTPRMAWIARHFVSLKLPGAARRLRARDLAAIDTYVARWSPAWRVPAGETDAAKRSLRAPGSLEAAIGYYRALRPWPTAAQRRRVSVPTVVFAGLDDPVPPAIYHRARRHFDASYDVVEMPGGHFMHREHPEHFQRELLRML